MESKTNSSMALGENAPCTTSYRSVHEVGSRRQARRLSGVGVRDIGRREAQPDQPQWALLVLHMGIDVSGAVHAGRLDGTLPSFLHVTELELGRIGE